VANPITNSLVQWNFLPKSAHVENFNSQTDITFVSFQFLVCLICGNPNSYLRVARYPPSKKLSFQNIVEAPNNDFPLLPQKGIPINGFGNFGKPVVSKGFLGSKGLFFKKIFLSFLSFHGIPFDLMDLATLIYFKLIRKYWS
jgi:hypothetical protein